MASLYLRWEIVQRLDGISRRDGCPPPFSIEFRLSGIDLRPNRAAAAGLTLNKEGENLRWFYFPFELEEAQDFSRPRGKAPPLIVSPKMYSCPQPTDWDDELGVDTRETVSSAVYLGLAPTWALVRHLICMEGRLGSMAPQEKEVE